MSKRNVSTEENSVNCALQDLLGIEEERQQKEEAAAEAVKEAKAIAKAEAELKAAKETEARILREEEIRQELEKAVKDDEARRVAEAEAIKIKAAKDAELAAQEKAYEHEAKLAAIEAEKKPIPKWIWGIVAAVVLTGCIGGYVQYSNSQEEKAQIRQAAEVQKLQLEAEKAQVEKQKEAEAAVLKAQAERKDAEAQKIKAELAEKEALLKARNTTKIPSKRRVRKVSTTSRRKGNNINSTDPLKGLSL